MPPNASRKAGSGKASPRRSAVPDRVVKRRRSVSCRVNARNQSPSPGGLSPCRPPMVTIHLPPPAATSGRRGRSPDVGNRPHGFPIGWGIVRDREDCRGIADIDTDGGFLGHRLPDGFEQAACGLPIARASTTRISRAAFPPSPSAFCKADRDDAPRDPPRVRDRDTRQRGRRRDVGVPFYAPTHHELDQRAGHRIQRQTAEIALRKGS